jgi:Flp pilus assembly protein TadD
VKHFSRAVELNPRDARAFDYLALNLEPLGEVNRADRAYQKAFAVDRRGPFYDGFLDYNYGRFLAKRGDFAASKPTSTARLNWFRTCAPPGMNAPN